MISESLQEKWSCFLCIPYMRNRFIFLTFSLMSGIVSTCKAWIKKKLNFCLNTEMVDLLVGYFVCAAITHPGRIKLSPTRGVSLLLT